MPTLKTEIKARIEIEQRDLFRDRAKSLGLTESVLLRRLVLAEIGQSADGSQPVEPVMSQDIETEQITLRLPRFLMTAVKARAQKKGMARSRWIAALVQSNLTGLPVMANAELFRLQASSRELLYIGRNINQISKELNQGVYKIEQIRLDVLAELKQAITESRGAIHALTRASQGVWTHGI